MIKKLYVLAWLLLTGSAVATILTDSLNGLSIVAFGLIALALVHALAFWSVVVNTRGPQPE